MYRTGSRALKGDGYRLKPSRAGAQKIVAFRRIQRKADIHGHTHKGQRAEVWQMKAMMMEAKIGADV